MSDKPKKVKPLETCHNSMAGCTNTCRPGYNFCDPCREFFGMKQHEEERKKAGIPVIGKYRHPLIGVGEAAQTHLHSKNMNAAIKKTLNDLRSMDKDELRKEIESRKEGDIAQILIETGALQEKETTMDEKAVDQKQLTSQRKSEALKKVYANNPRVGIFFDGWLKEWIEASAAERGMTLHQYITDMIMERIPDEVVAAGVRADLRRKGRG